MHVRKVMLASSALLCVAVAMIFALVGTALANLPDHRAYEMVSPVEKGGQSFIPELAFANASGERIIVDGGVANSLLSNGASWELETRTPTGWSGVQVGPPPPLTASYQDQRETQIVAANEDFSRIAFQTLMTFDPRDTGSSEALSSNDVYVREGPTGPFAWTTGPPAPVVKVASGPLGNYNNGECLNAIQCYGNSVMFAGSSSDLSHVVWSQRKPLTSPSESLPASPPDTHAYGNEVYESVNGADQLVGLVPSGENRECNPSQGSCLVPVCGAAMGNVFYSTNGEGYGGSEGFAPVKGAVSGDGSQVVFTSPDPNTAPVAGCEAAPEIYVHDGGTSVVNVSASQKTNGTGSGGQDPNGAKFKLYAGSAEENGHITIVFFTSQEALTNDANTGSSDQGNDLYAYSLETGQLTDLTSDKSAQDLNGAEVTGFIGAATNGSLVYFTASGALAPGGIAGQSNLYVHDATTGQTSYIASGNGVYGIRIGEFNSAMTSQVTSNGQYLAFMSSENLTSYKQEGKAQVYLYNQVTGDLVCASCNPSGAAPTGEVTWPGPMPAGYIYYPSASTLPLPRVVSEDGKVFFNSAEQLTPEAPLPVAETEYNPAKNVYEYENGHVYLISAKAKLVGLTPSGNDAFFDTSVQLLPQDGDGTPDIYDARINGGFPALAPPACSGTSCQGVPASPPIFATPPSVTFTGIGNFPSPSSTPAVKSSKAKKRVKSKAKKKIKKKNKRAKFRKRSDKGGK